MTSLKIYEWRNYMNLKLLNRFVISANMLTGVPANTLRGARVVSDITAGQMTPSNIGFVPIYRSFSVLHIIAG